MKNKKGTFRILEDKITTITKPPRSLLPIEIKWTDKMVIEFAKVATLGPYGQYAGCRTLESKLNKFKEIHLKS